MKPEFFTLAEVCVEWQTCHRCPTPTCCAVQVGFLKNNHESMVKVDVPLCEDCFSYENGMNAVTETVQN